MRNLLRRFRYLLHQRQTHTDLNEELEFHREMAEQELRATGLPARDIPLRAHQRLGNRSLSHDQVRDVWVPPPLQGIGQDFRLAVRTLIRTPLLSAVCLLSLTLGIGANTALFSVMNGLLLRELPVEHPGDLVSLVDETNAANPFWDYRIWREIDRRTPLFDSTLAWADARFNMAKGGETAYVSGLRVSGSFFRTLGVSALLGRTLSAADDTPGGGPDGPVAVISYQFWQRHFGGAPAVVGATLPVDRMPFTVVGVMPREFFGIDIGRSFDVAVPIQVQAASAADGAAAALPLVRIIGRLRPDSTIAATTTALRAVQPQIREATLPQGWPPAFLERYLRGAFTLIPAADASRLRRQFSRPLAAIMVVVSLVLLVACANLANLAGARAAARRRELGLRLALGASRARLLRQLMAESAVLAGCGAALGLLSATWTAGLLVRQLSTTVGTSGPHASTGSVVVDVSTDVRVLAFTVAVAVVTVVLVGVLPALRASRVAPLDALMERPGGVGRLRRVAVADVFLAIQVAVSVIVIVAAGLFGRTLASLQSRPLGVNHHGILVATVDAERTAVPPERRQRLYADILDTVRERSGVTHAAFSSVPPVVNGPTPGNPIQAISGEPPLPPRGASVGLNLISPDWFDTMGIPIVSGRDVRSDDRANTVPVVIVNQMFARRFVHGGSPVGRTVTLFLPGPPSPPVEIVGVVADTVYGGMRDQIEPTIFLPVAQLGPIWWRFLSPMTLSVRSVTSRPELLTKSVGTAIGAVDPDISVTFHTMTDYVDDALVQERLTAWLSGAFALLAVLLAAVGLYGVAAYSVVGRRTEIGIRIALGAAPADIVRLVLVRVFRPVAAGLVGGIALSLWLSQLIESLLFELRPRDPATLIMAVGALAGVALVASWLPARRVARIDPATVVRCS